MTGFLIGLSSVILFILCAFIVMIVLMQRASSNTGMGATLGGGATDNILGADSGNVLTRWTIYSAVAFFVICFGLYLINMYRVARSEDAGARLPDIANANAPSELKYIPGSLTDVDEDATEYAHESDN